MTKLLTIVTSVYRAEKYLDLYFKNMFSLNNIQQIRVIVIINAATEIERDLTEIYKKRYPDIFEIVYTPQETIGVSTNRGYKMADTPYVAYADVDDLRPADAYERQMHTLDENPDIDFTYGDFIEVEKIGETKGKLIRTAEFDENEFSRGSMVGPNHFFRRSLLEKTGFWDEQLRSGGDFDFQVRAALNCKFKKTSGGPLLYKLMGENTQSASKGILQPVERTVIELRYGIYDKIDYRYLHYAIRYNISGVLQFGVFKQIDEFIPNYSLFIDEMSNRYINTGVRSYFLKEINPVWKIARKVKSAIKIGFKI